MDGNYNIDTKSFDNLPSLTTVDLSGSARFINVPNFTNSPKIVKFIHTDCKSLSSKWPCINKEQEQN
jgi:hypothetical protein